ncbi:MAG: 50S ribosomal protein L19 [bacterium]
MDTVQISKVTSSQIKTDLPTINVGDTVKVFTKVKEAKGIRSQAFEGIVTEHRHGGIETTIVVRKLSDAGVFVEKILAIHSPAVDKIEIIKKGRVRRAKLGYLRGRVGKQALYVKPAEKKK